jgi:uncharacterized protein
MADPTKEVKKSHEQEGGATLTRGKAFQAVVFGLMFGFLLQKGGVAKYDLLIGVLLFQDFTVIKMMGSAIVVGMVGLFLLSRRGLIEFKIKPTRYASVIGGGLLFGAGFALSGYCPGTAAAALGQTSWDAAFVMFGMVLGSFVFAEASNFLSRTVERVGDRGKVTIPQLLNFHPGSVMLFLATVLLGVLSALQYFGR